MITGNMSYRANYVQPYLGWGVVLGRDRFVTDIISENGTKNSQEERVSIQQLQTLY